MHWWGGASLRVGTGPPRGGPPSGYMPAYRVSLCDMLNQGVSWYIKIEKVGESGSSDSVAATERGVAAVKEVRPSLSELKMK